MYLRPKPRTSAPPDPQVGYLAQQLLLQHAPGEKIGVGQPDCPQPITINLPAVAVAVGVGGFLLLNINSAPSLTVVVGVAAVAVAVAGLDKWTKRGRIYERYIRIRK